MSPASLPAALSSSLSLSSLSDGGIIPTVSAWPLGVWVHRPMKPLSSSLSSPPSSPPSSPLSSSLPLPAGGSRSSGPALSLSQRAMHSFCASTTSALFAQRLYAVKSSRLRKRKVGPHLNFVSSCSARPRSPTMTSVAATASTHESFEALPAGWGRAVDRRLGARGPRGHRRARKEVRE